MESFNIFEETFGVVLVEETCEICGCHLRLNEFVDGYTKCEDCGGGY